MGDVSQELFEGQIDSEYAVSLISNTGPLAQNSDFFEERPSQMALLHTIAEAFNESRIGIFEAGTGVGKSFAYLIPAILFAATQGRRVVISTGTINLQQQLAQKDVPAALRITGKELKCILLKGRQNYVCLRRLADALEEKDLFTEEADELDQIYEWAKVSKDGSKSDLSFQSSESLWQRINSESDACMGRKCPYADKCFVQKVRREASDAQILIVNHHLLFADIEMRMGGSGYDDAAVLPSYHHLIFDEAHGIENAATSFFSETISRFKIIKQLNYLYRQRRGSAQGYLFTLEALSSAEIDLAQCVALSEELKTKLIHVEDAALDLMDNEYTWRLHKGNAASAEPFLYAMRLLAVAISDFCGLVRNVINGISEDDQETQVVWESKQILRRIESVGQLCNNFGQWEEKTDTVFWMSKRRLANGSWLATIVQTPLEIAGKMNSGVFEPMETVVCTSATLTVGRDFGYWLRRTGVHFADQERVVTQQFDSPFPYSSNMLLCIPQDAPMPSDRSFQSWVESAIVQLIQASDGRALVLFTSYDSLKYACTAARSALESTGITVLMQGDDDRFKLLETFKNDEKSVLFATDSFWEGVDVPGTSLSHVIIVKLPFSVPNDPVFEARSESIQNRGGNPFMELSVPDAVVHFRQGVGRLIRRSTDRGAVTVLDTRLVKKQYGSLFLNSIPNCNRIVAPLSDILRQISRFI